MPASRYVVGIDLGTTNSVVAYIDARESRPGAAPALRLLPIPQLVAEREVRALGALPSFVYFADEREIESGATRTPWSADGRVVVGAYARDRGALAPARLVASAKSWLCNPDVDRTAPILPFGGDDASIRCSPVEASARILAHLRDAWNRAMPEPLDDQEVVVTVPASFDDEARELTVQAAFQAGIERFTLLEEPLAAFYAWIAAFRDSLAERISDGDVVLVCDVGGGTTDFSLVRARVVDDDVAFERIAVGEHLLLGGDNVDHALAARVEARLDGPALTATQRAALRQQCRVAKERLLADPDLERVAIAVLGTGASVVGRARSAELTIDDVEETLVLGFLPVTEPGDLPARDRRAGLREIGLPYVHDPAVTRHLAEFLTRAGDGTMVRPDAVLYNGGFFTPEPARDHMTEAIAQWFRRDDPEWTPKVLVDEVAESVVAVGAAYFGLVRRGEGVRVGGGTPRSYFLGIETGTPLAPGEVSVVCVVPKGTEEGTVLTLAERTFALATNRPVAFALYSSTTLHDAHGAVRIAREEYALLHHHAPLVTVLRYGRRDAHVDLAVRVAASVTELGTLELWCESVETAHRWRLQFQLSSAAAEPDALERARDDGPQVVVSESAIDEATELMRAVFGDAPSGSAADSPTPGTLVVLMESALGHGKDAWPVDAARALFDRLVAMSDGRTRSARHEARFLNLLGFCLRPGFGAAGDAERVARALEIENTGLAFPRDVQCQVEREVFLQRIAGGLDAATQTRIAERLSAALGIGIRGARPKTNPQLERESWRALASLERLPAPVRARVGQELLARLKADPGNRSFPWGLARLGGRLPFYGTVRSVISPKIAAEWMSALLRLEPITHELAFAIAQIGARTNDPARDVDEVVRQRAIARLGAAGFRERTLAPLRRSVAPERDHAARVFGESLPSGLRLVE